MTSEVKTELPTSGPYKGSVVRALEGKNVLVTGATGFLGKVVIEKILRSVPKVNKVYILVRPRKGSTSKERMQKEVIDSEVFNTLRKERSDFNDWVHTKLLALPGELTQNQVGLSDKDLAFMQDTLNVIIHCAAVVDFNERLDRAVELNVMGALRLMEIAQKCKNIGAFVHVSTAYVNSNRFGWVDEKLYPLGFDPEQMVAKVRTMNTTQLEQVSESGMLGDWPNTYTFTKAMAEHLMFQKRGRVPLVIVRPSIIGCSWREPQPGWIDVISAAAAVYMAVGLGVLQFLPGTPETVADIVPIDYVVNTMLAVIPAIYDQQEKFFVAQACTSSERPMQWASPQTVIVDYFSDHPHEKALGKPKFDFTKTPQEYQLQFFLRYSVPSSILNTLATASKSYKDKAAQFNKLVWKVRVLIESFRHFVENEWEFDNRNTRTCGQLLNPEERKMFPLDLSELDWDAYNRTFGFGLMRFVAKQDLVEVTDLSPTLSLTRDPSTMKKGSVADRLKRRFLDIGWAIDKFQARSNVTYPKPRPVAEMQSLIFTSAAVQAAIKAEAARTPSQSNALEAADKRARDIIERMFGDTSVPVVTGMGWAFRKIWRRLYKNIDIDKAGLARVQEAAAKGPLILIPTHRSYIDFLVVSYMCFHAGLPMPYIAAGEDFLGILLVRWLFRKAGAFFLRRSFMGGDNLYATIFREYVQRLLIDGQSIEFFIEGTRSRSGKMLHPKLGLLSIITDVFLDKKIPDATIVPITLNYEKTMEGNLYSDELLGNSKIRESLRSLIGSRSVLNVNFGAITVGFGELTTLKQYTAQHIAAMKGSPSLPRSVGSFNPDDDEDVPDTKTETKRGGKVEGKGESKGDSKTAVVLAAEGGGGSSASYDPFSQKADRRHLNRKLAYKVVYDLTVANQCMPTHIVAALMLMYRQGITKAQLVTKVDWLRQEIIARGGIVACVQGNSRTQIVDSAIKHLNGVVVQRRQNVFEPAISARTNYKNMLVLGFYRNKIMHYFFRESLWACALYSFGESATKDHGGVDKTALLTEVKFLHTLLHREFIYKLNPDEPEDFEAVFDAMVAQGILRLTENKRVEVAPTGEVHFSFLCAILWPFIDSYFAATMILFSLQHDRSMEESQLVHRSQWLAETLYHESMLCFYESCSLETLRNALHVLQEWKVIKLQKEKSGKGGTAIKVSLLAPYNEEKPLQELVQRISRLRKPAPVRHGTSRSNLIADIPILAKL